MVCNKIRVIPTAQSIHIYKEFRERMSISKGVIIILGEKEGKN